MYWVKFSNQKIENGSINKNQDASICCLEEAHFRSRGTHRLKVKDRKKIHANRKDKKAAIAN